MAQRPKVIVTKEATPRAFSETTDPALLLAEAPFAEAAKPIIERVRTTIRAVLTASPGTPERAQQVVDSLGLDLNLAWKLVNVVQAEDIYAGAQQIPGANGMAIFLRAAAGKGVPESLLERVREAMHLYDELVRVHAGNRIAMDSMLGHHARSGGERADMAARRAAMKANAGILGVQVRAQTHTCLLKMNPEQPEMWDLMTIRGVLGLERLRRDLSWVISRGTYTDDDGAPRDQPERVPLDRAAAAANHGVPLLSGFGSPVAPTFRRRAEGDGTVVDELTEGPVGRRGATTFYTGELVRRCGHIRRREHNEITLLGARLHTPCEELLFDVLVHRDYRWSGQLHYRLISELGGASIHTTPPERLLHLPRCERVEPMGVGANALWTEASDEYPSVVQAACGGAGWRLEEFEVFRIAIKFPPIPAAALVHHDNAE